MNMEFIVSGVYLLGFIGLCVGLLLNKGNKNMALWFIVVLNYVFVGMATLMSLGIYSFAGSVGVVIVIGIFMLCSASVIYAGVKLYRNFDA